MGYGLGKGQELSGCYGVASSPSLPLVVRWLVATVMQFASVHGKEGEAKGGRKKTRDILGNTRIHYSTEVHIDIRSIQ